MDSSVTHTPSHTCTYSLPHRILCNLTHKDTNSPTLTDTLTLTPHTLTQSYTHKDTNSHTEAPEYLSKYTLIL